MRNDMLKNSYWCGSGKHQEAADKLQALLPSAGEVEDAVVNRELETFRIAVNAYYDLYNNGLCNRGDEFRKVFGFRPSTRELEEFRLDFQQRVESLMDEIIAMAVVEQADALEHNAKPYQAYRVGFWFTEYGTVEVSARTPEAALAKVRVILEEDGVNSLRKKILACANVRINDRDIGVQDAEVVA